MNANGMYNDAALRPNLYQSGFDPRQFLRLNTNEEDRWEWSLSKMKVAPKPLKTEVLRATFVVPVVGLEPTRLCTA